VSLTDVIDRILPADADLATVLDTVYQRRYTGTITVHLQNGRPKVVEFPGTQIRLLTKPTLDKSADLSDAQRPQRP